MPTHDPQKHVPLKFGLLLFPQFEVLDVFGPLECLNTLVRLENFKHKQDLSLTVLARSLKVVSSGPIPADPKPFNVNIAQSVQPTHTLDNAPDIDVLLVPGGYGTGPHTMSGFAPDVSEEVAFIANVFPRLKYLITVCTGATLAAQAGVLDNRAATTNKQAWASITPTGPKTYWVAHARWVRSADDKVWTTSGVSAGTDGFLALLGHVYDSDGLLNLVDEVCRSMEYTRAATAQDDPWARVDGVVDVPPVAWLGAATE